VVKLQSSASLASSKERYSIYEISTAACIFVMHDTRFMYVKCIVYASVAKSRSLVNCSEPSVLSTAASRRRVPCMR
jgi:hypothetical protein